MPLATRDLLSVFRRWAAEYGDLFYYRAAWMHVYFLNHPDLIDTALVRNQQNLVKDSVIRNSRWFLGEGLLTGEGEYWKRQRRLSQPAFHREKISSYASVLTPGTSFTQKICHLAMLAWAGLGFRCPMAWTSRSSLSLTRRMNVLGFFNPHAT